MTKSMLGVYVLDVSTLCSLLAGPPFNALFVISGTRDVQTFTRFLSPDSVWEAILVSVPAIAKDHVVA